MTGAQLEITQPPPQIVTAATGAWVPFFHPRTSRHSGTRKKEKRRACKGKSQRKRELQKGTRTLRNGYVTAGRSGSPLAVSGLRRVGRSSAGHDGG